MPDELSEDFDFYNFTRDVLQSQKIFNIDKRNWVEAIFFTIFTVVIIQKIPFVPTVKTIFSIVLGLSMFIFNLRGIKNRSITQMISAEIKYRKNRRELHLRSPEYVKKSSKGKSFTESDKSVAEIYIKYFTERLNRFIEEYSEEEVS